MSQLNLIFELTESISPEVFGKRALHENEDGYPKLPPEHILGRGSKTCVDVMGIGASVCHVGG